jgi:simple sugar transport system permease protein
VKQKLRNIGLFLAAPVIAAVAALLISSITLLISGHSPSEAYSAMWDYVTTADSIVAVINRAVPYYVAGVAVAIGFKMNLFNIGVDGQYRLAALLSAAVGASVDLPAPLQVSLMLLVAVSVGSAYAGIAGVLKVTRGVNEVVSTIMLNFIATGISAYLLFNYFKNPEANLVAETRPLPHSGQLPSLNSLLSRFSVDLPKGTVLQGYLPYVILIGIGFYVLIYRTRFGFDLRATGMNPNAARSSGVNPKAMILKTMLISGAVAGLAGMGPLLADIHKYGDTFPTAIGFTGIAVALLGRNNPIGIGFAALVFAGIERASQNLSTVGVPQEIGRILQGTLLLTAVIAFEVVHRYRERLTVKEAAARTADDRPAPPSAPLPVGATS